MPTKTPLFYLTIILLVTICNRLPAATIIPAVSEGTVDVQTHAILLPSTLQPFLYAVTNDTGHEITEFIFEIPQEYHSIILSLYAVNWRCELGVWGLDSRGTNNPDVDYSLWTQTPVLQYWNISGYTYEWQTDVTASFDAARDAGWQYVGYCLYGLGDTYGVAETASKFLLWDGAHGPQLLVLPEPSGLLALLPALLTFHRKRV